MCTCIQVAVFYIISALGLLIDQLTLGPLRNMAQSKPFNLAVEISMLVVSSITEGIGTF